MRRGADSRAPLFFYSLGNIHAAENQRAARYREGRYALA